MTLHFDLFSGDSLGWFCVDGRAADEILAGVIGGLSDIPVVRPYQNLSFETTAHSVWSRLVFYSSNFSIVVNLSIDHFFFIREFPVSVLTDPGSVFSAEPKFRVVYLLFIIVILWELAWVEFPVVWTDTSFEASFDVLVGHTVI